MYEKVRRYYELGLWSIEHVRKAVEKGALTAEEFERMTGKKYK